MRETHQNPKEEQRMQEEPLIPEKTMRCVKIDQNHVDKEMIINNNPNKEVPREAPRVQ